MRTIPNYEIVLRALHRKLIIKIGDHSHTLNDDGELVSRYSQNENDGWHVNDMRLSVFLRTCDSMHEDDVSAILLALETSEE